MVIRTMFWAFPYLLWQAFGNGSGFVVGVIVALVLTLMFNNLFHTASRNTPLYTAQQSFKPADRAEDRREVEPYQRGYRAEPVREEQPQVWESKSQYEEMQVPYPQQEMPPMEQRQ